MTGHPKITSWAINGIENPSTVVKDTCQPNMQIHVEANYCDVVTFDEEEIYTNGSGVVVNTIRPCEPGLHELCAAGNGNYGYDGESDCRTFDLVEQEEFPWLVVGGIVTVVGLGIYLLTSSPP